MSSSFLADPKLLAVVLASFLGALGTAFTWLWKRVSGVMEEHRKCELELVQVRTEMTALRIELSKVQGTCGTLTDLLRKEVHIG